MGIMKAGLGAGTVGGQGVRACVGGGDGAKERGDDVA